MPESNQHSSAELAETLRSSLDYLYNWTGGKGRTECVTEGREALRGLVEQLEAAREAVQACYDDLLRYAPPHWRNQGKGEILARNFLNSNPASEPEGT